MWYFSWLLGLGFAVLLAVMNAMWGEFTQDRKESLKEDKEGPEVEYE